MIRFLAITPVAALGLLGTSILMVPGHRHSESEVEHRFRCRSCFFRWSEYV